MVVTTKLWRRMPPAVFPCLLGFIGLGLAWRRAADVWVIPPWVGEVILAVSCLMFIVTGISYFMKLSLRPSVIFDDLKPEPAKGAISAASMCLMLVSTALIPYFYGLAQLLWWAALVQHTFHMVCIIIVMARSGAKFADITPALLLPFVGFIVACIGGSELGYSGFLEFLLLAILPVCIFIIVWSLINLKKFGLGNPQRASYFIILAPISVYGIGAYNIWSDEIYIIFWYIALISGLCFIPFIGWLRAGGWSPAWGAFTFPLSAFATVMLTGVQSDFGILAAIMSILSLAGASILVPYVVFKTYHLWAVGKLAQATGAATA